MNEAELPSINLDELRLVPDWLRENAPSPSKQYAAFDRPMEGDRPPRRGPRDGRGFGGGGGGGGGGRRDDRGRSGPPRNDRGPGRRPERPPMAPRDVSQPVVPAPLRVEFLPDERCMASIIKQIRSTHMAYPLFSLARMFLQEPARHYLQLSLVPGAAGPGTSLYQLGEDGPVTMDRAALEALAFDTSKERFYKEESVQKDPPKGNFTNVARERTTGTLLGPTNYHGYQPALRSLYESRFSRRMSFEDYRRNIEVSADPALVERWKEEARTSVSISTLTGEPPVTFPSMAETKLHFRQNYLDALVHKGMSFRLHGSVARRLPEPAIMQAIREAHDRELRYPAQFVQLLRQGLQNAGLHIFKHRKRIVYVAATRPTPFVPSGGAVTENVSRILEIIGKSPLCTRKFLAEQILGKAAGGRRAKSGKLVENRPPVPAAETPETAGGDQPEAVMEAPVLASAPEAQEGVQTTDLAPPLESPEEVQTAVESPTPELVPAASEAVPTEPTPFEDEFAKAKTTLAADLRFLIQAGHIIEFHNSTFDLPLTPKQKEEPVKAIRGANKPTPESTESIIGEDPAAVTSPQDEEAGEPAATRPDTSLGENVTETVTTNLAETSTPDLEDASVSNSSESEPSTDEVTAGADTEPVEAQADQGSTPGTDVPDHHPSEEKA